MKLDKICEELGKRYFELELKKKKTQSEEEEFKIIKGLKRIIIKIQGG